MLPTFIIAGVEKSGSTSLYNYLAQHPTVFMSDIKEPNFFLGTGPITTEEEYRWLFREARPDQARGEASVGYMNDPSSAARMRSLLPDVDVVIMLRHPVERAYSHYNMLVSFGATPPRPYIDALRSAHKRGNFANTGIPTSHYFEGLTEFKDQFGDQVQIYLYEDFKDDPIQVSQRVFRQIGVDASFCPNVTTHHNRTYRPANNTLHAALRHSHPLKSAVKSVLPTAVLKRMNAFLGKANRSPVPPLDPEARAFVLTQLMDDIENTEAMLGMDLSTWKQ